VSVLDAEARLVSRTTSVPAGVPASSELDETCRLTASIVSRRAENRGTAGGHGLLDKIEPHTHDGSPRRPLRRGDRAFPHRPGYVDAKTLAQPCDGRGGARAPPPSCRKIGKRLFRVDGNIQPWCISRQLWWGHQIPPGTGRTARSSSPKPETRHSPTRSPSTHANGTISEAEGEKIPADASRRSQFWCATRRAGYLVLLGAVAVSRRSAARRYAGAQALLSTDVLVTGFDIIFFWVARMMMMSLHVMKEVPFPTVYIHALVRDEKAPRCRSRRATSSTRCI